MTGTENQSEVEQLHVHVVVYLSYSIGSLEKKDRSKVLTANR